MTIKIIYPARHYNCHWYCMKEGQTFRAQRFDEKLNCYVVVINNLDHLVSKCHAEEVAEETIEIMQTKINEKKKSHQR